MASKTTKSASAVAPTGAGGSDKATPVVEYVNTFLGEFLGAKLVESAGEDYAFSLADILAVVRAKTGEEYDQALRASYANVGSGAGYYQLDNADKIAVVRDVLGVKGIEALMSIPAVKINPAYETIMNQVHAFQATLAQIPAGNPALATIQALIDANMKAAAALPKTIPTGEKGYRAMGIADALNFLYRVAVEKALAVASITSDAKARHAHLAATLATQGITKARPKSSEEGNAPRAKVVASNKAIMKRGV